MKKLVEFQKARRPDPTRTQRTTEPHPIRIQGPRGPKSYRFQATRGATSTPRATPHAELPHTQGYPENLGLLQKTWEVKKQEETGGTPETTETSSH